MEVIIDGFPEEVSLGLSLAELIQSRDEETVHLIVEINRRFIHRRDYSTTILKEGDRVEIIHPAFGG
jgi:thiamine biosynthesis protein ThiS